MEGGIDDEVVCGLFGALVSKLANTRINESFSAKIERDPKARPQSCSCARDALTETEILLSGCQTQADAQLIVYCN